MQAQNPSTLEEIISKYSKRPQKKPMINSSSIKKNYKFSNDEKKQLKELFEKSSYYPDKDLVKKLSEELNIDLMKIENWFKYERRKMLASGKSHLMEKRKKFTKKELTFLKNKLKEDSEPSQEKMEAWSNSLNCSTGIIGSWVRNLKKKQKKVETDAKFIEECKECTSNSLINANTNNVPNPLSFPNPMPNFLFNPMMLRLQNAFQNPFFFPMGDWNYYDFHY